MTSLNEKDTSGYLVSDQLIRKTKDPFTKMVRVFLRNYKVTRKQFQDRLLAFYKKTDKDNHQPAELSVDFYREYVLNRAFSIPIPIANFIFEHVLSLKITGFNFIIEPVQTELEEESVSPPETKAVEEVTDSTGTMLISDEELNALEDSVSELHLDTIARFASHDKEPDDLNQEPLSGSLEPDNTHPFHD